MPEMPGTTFMSIESLFAKVDDLSDLRATRRAIVDRIAATLDRHRNALGRWEKDHLVTAISALHWNVNHLHQPSSWWLRYCLLNIAKAEIPPHQRSEMPSPRDEVLDGISYDQSRTELSDLRQQILACDHAP